MENLKKIETLAESRLSSCFGEAEGKQLWGIYMSARQKAIHDILPFIARYEPNLTDHGARHVEDVLENAFLLLGKEACQGTDSRHALTAAELYFLVMAILFHDLGNIFGRKEHNRRLEEVLHWCRGDDCPNSEKRQLLSIVEAHCGHTREGSKDTIGNLDNASSFKKTRLDCRRVAAILRLADELAEGPQRTSQFIRSHFPQSEDSVIFHQYATITEVFIDRGGGRIVLTYNVEVAPNEWKQPYDEIRLKQLLEFCYARAVKLDLERKYNKHHCSLLRAFERTEISFHFYHKCVDLRVGIQKIVLDDLILPEPTKEMSLIHRQTELDLAILLPRLREAAGFHSVPIPSAQCTQ